MTPLTIYVLGEYKQEILASSVDQKLIRVVVIFVLGLGLVLAIGSTVALSRIDRKNRERSQSKVE